jgi:hypothetical protein
MELLAAKICLPWLRDETLRFVRRCSPRIEKLRNSEAKKSAAVVKRFEALSVDFDVVVTDLPSPRKSLPLHESKIKIYTKQKLFIINSCR